MTDPLEPLPTSIPGWTGDMTPLRAWVEQCVNRRLRDETRSDEEEDEGGDEDEDEDEDAEEDEDEEDEGKDSDEEEEEEDEDDNEVEDEDEEDKEDEEGSDDEDDLTDLEEDIPDLFGSSGPIAVDLYVGGTAAAVALLSSRRVALSDLSAEDAWAAVWQQICEYLTQDVDPNRRIVVVQLRSVVYTDDLGSLDLSGEAQDPRLPPVHCQFTRVVAAAPKNVVAPVPFASEPPPNREAVLRAPAATVPGMLHQEYTRPPPIGISPLKPPPPPPTQQQHMDYPATLPQTLNPTPAPVQVIPGYNNSVAQGQIVVGLTDFMQLLRGPYDTVLHHYQDEVSILRGQMADFLRDMREDKAEMHRALRRITDQSAQGDRLRNRAIQTMMRAQANATARVYEAKSRADRATSQAEQERQNDRLRFQIAMARAEANAKKAVAPKRSSSGDSTAKPVKERVTDKLGDAAERILDKVTDQLLSPSMEDPAQLAAAIHKMDPKVRAEALRLLAQGDPELADTLVRDLDSFLDTIADQPSDESDGELDEEDEEDR